MRRSLWLIALILALVSATTGAAEKQAFEVADYYRTAFVGAPELSPDGMRVALTVTRYELEKGESWSEIWITGSHGSRPRQMTAGRHHDGSPAFSPDGKSLVFVSDRAGDGNQLFVMPVDGGEARQLTKVPTGVADPVWSPDGRWIAVTSKVYPECGGDSECNRTTLEAATGGPLKAYLADELLYRHWDSWREGRYPHVLLIDAASGKVAADLTPGRFDSPTFSLGGGPGYAFSPASDKLCFVSNREDLTAASTNADLWVVSIGEGSPRAEPENLTAENLGWDGSPHYSPDGRYMAYLSQQKAGHESDLFRIAVRDLEHGYGSIPDITGRVRQLGVGHSVASERWLSVLSGGREGEDSAVDGGSCRRHDSGNPPRRYHLGLEGRFQWSGDCVHQIQGRLAL